jgi:hypothetical protein
MGELEILTDLHILSAPEYEKVSFRMLCTTQAPERLDVVYFPRLRVCSSQVGAQ